MNENSCVQDPKGISLDTEETQRKYLYRGLDWFGTVVPGLALAGLLAWMGTVLAKLIGVTLLGYEKTPISAIMVTILLGLLVRNIAGLPAAYEAGLRFAVKRILRFGITLLGLRLSLLAVGKIGISALPVVLGCIISALILVTCLSRLMGLPTRLGSLIAVGTSICGASAIVAAAPAIDAEEDEVSYAVACITIFGIIALLTYPYLAHWIFAGNTEHVGLFLGTAIHETSQVAGAGLMYQQHYDAPMALNIAATTKLVRNVCMGAVIPVMAVIYHRGNTTSQTGDNISRKWYQYVPLFVIAFVVLTAVRTVGDLGTKAFGVISQSAWQDFIVEVKVLSVACLTIAMGAIGLGTSLTKLRTLGIKPLLVGLAAAVLVGGVSLILIRLFITAL